MSGTDPDTDEEMSEQMSEPQHQHNERKAATTARKKKNKGTKKGISASIATVVDQFVNNQDYEFVNNLTTLVTLLRRRIEEHPERIDREKKTVVNQDLIVCMNNTIEEDRVEIFDVCRLLQRKPESRRLSFCPVCICG